MTDSVDVLVVDDERMNLKLIKGVLKNSGHILALAESGREALELVQKHDFAVALLDVMMPDMDGFMLAEALRSAEKTKNIPIIFITAISKEQRHVFHGYELGAVDYLFKPVEPEILRSKVDIFAELHRRKIHLERTTRRLESTIKELEASKAALEQSESRYRTVANYNHDWESWFDPEGKPLYISPSCQRISGYHQERFMKEYDLLERILHVDDQSAWRNFMRDKSAGSDPLDLRIFHKNSKLRWISVVKQHVVDENGNELGVRTSMRDVSSRKRMQEQLEYKSLHDSLTGLSNRVLFLDRVGRAIERSARSEQYFAIIFVNIDRFQAVNGNYGHAVGDMFLVSVGVRLKQAIELEDTLARFGGDEFILLVEGLSRKSDAREIAAKIHAVFEAPFVAGDFELSLSASVGVEIAKGDARDSERYVSNAQLAMHNAKTGNKKKPVVYSSKMREGAVNVLAMESELKRAIKNNEFVIFFQPVVNMADGSLFGFEALVRWQHPQRGLLGPGEFIPVAEETGLIVELGSQILEKACLKLTDWRTRFPMKASDLSISVNISARQFRESTLVKEVKEVLATTKLPPKCLKLEITETDVMVNAVSSSTQLNMLKELGVMLSIDDFGTGYSSMSYLQKFPVDQLKVDLSFVRRMEKAPENIEIIRAIVNMAHSLRLRVVAEGIETERQRDLLYSLQCDYGQGYLYSRPLPSDEADDYIVDFNC